MPKFQNILIYLNLNVNQHSEVVLPTALRKSQIFKLFVSQCFTQGGLISFRNRIKLCLWLCLEFFKTMRLFCPSVEILLFGFAK